MQEDLFDETTWTPPDVLPDLSGEKIICINVETRDPNLLSKGPVLLLHRTIGMLTYLLPMTVAITCLRRRFAVGCRIN